MPGPKIKGIARALRLKANNFLFGALDGEVDVPLPSLCEQKDCDISPVTTTETSLGLPIELIVDPLYNENVPEYCVIMRRDGQWGSAAEIMALPHSLRKTVSVWREVSCGKSLGLASEYSLMHHLDSIV